ncbi:MAG: SUMF1/EgtB/PvdO family nonheme iron enzyme [Lewinellaceae bacterium]|nr:SUMF1/EgtB/PvdO family nonheme iron enzyme [Saprospiraceae bacterium]MCB9317099.1 SUMF1/EgtB/PvdO family nonheme iron enzyme [Lewinellaceae bacterium]MCB9333786.1 SUMF1/EgtB/PvdO family nonheme iron enzyme [Lewinellaceae bacterium]
MKPLKTFIIYSSKDKIFRAELENHLRPLVDLGWLELWSDKEILPGERWDAAIKKQLAQTELFLMLISVDFYNSDYIRREEFKMAVARMEKGTALLIPIIVRDCHWEIYPVIKDLQVLPQSGVAVTDLDYWKNHDKAWNAVVKGLGVHVQALQTKSIAGKSEKSSEKKVASVISVVTQESAKVAAQPKFKNGDTLRDLPFSPVMVFVEGGPFQMGSSEEKSEQPIHEVTVPSFWIGRYPVTSMEYDRFCEDTGRQKPGGRGRYPVTHVSWEDAQFYCEWLSAKTGKNYRLPSEVEWEFAARGGTLSKGYQYAGGNDLLRVGWYQGNSNTGILPQIAQIALDVTRGYYQGNSNTGIQQVGIKAPNELGIHDMSGNVWEWCQDQWHNNYKGAPADGSAWEDGGTGALRVYRGGSWHNDPQDCRAANRDNNGPTLRSFDVGFRLVLQSVG